MPTTIATIKKLFQDRFYAYWDADNSAKKTDTHLKITIQCFEPEKYLTEVNTLIEVLKKRGCIHQKFHSAPRAEPGAPGVVILEIPLGYILETPNQRLPTALLGIGEGLSQNPTFFMRSARFQSVPSYASVQMGAHYSGITSLLYPMPKQPHPYVTRALTLKAALEAQLIDALLAGNHWEVVRLLPLFKKTPIVVPQEPLTTAIRKITGRQDDIYEMCFNFTLHSAAIDLYIAQKSNQQSTPFKLQKRLKTIAEVIAIILEKNIDASKQLRSHRCRLVGYYDFQYLHIAVWKNDVELVKVLLSSNLMSSRDDHNRKKSVFHQAFYMAARNANIPIMLLFINRFAINGYVKDADLQLLTEALLSMLDHILHGRAEQADYLRYVMAATVLLGYGANKQKIFDYTENIRKWKKNTLELTREIDFNIRQFVVDFDKIANSTGITYMLDNTPFAEQETLPLELLEIVTEYMQDLSFEIQENQCNGFISYKC